MLIQIGIEASCARPRGSNYKKIRLHFNLPLLIDQNLLITFYQYIGN
jgi:hypothetical protein